MKNNLRNRGFSLVEVVVAVGIFSLAIVGVIGLLGPTSKSVAEVSDSDAATRVVTAIQTELQRLASTSAGWTQLTSAPAAQRLLRLSSEVATEPSDLTATSYTLYADRSGSKIGLPTSSVWNGSDKDKFFEITLIRNGDYPSAGDGLSPAANDSTAGFLAFTVRLRWPAFLPNGTKAAPSAKSSMIVPMAVTR